ncbi:hypothetical protein [Rhizobium leguminosarum]|uniref:hypothetical protein n=1 Tax=Rhizobium leguminosarum TaxID=384 RepID=UPI000FEC7038|nr:hypothetical protein [Rhizobium leguminosarum]RWX35228.1 hypothetical protein EHI43_11340 [Rhizobium leguminosarum]
MPNGNGISFHMPRYDFAVKARWLESNPRIIETLKAAFPTKALFSHVVVSGQTVGAVTRIRYDGPGVMVPRVFGSVFFYQPSQKINLCYGEITESATVNQFAEVIPEDLDALRELGSRVWSDTVANPVRHIVEVNIQEW